MGCGELGFPCHTHLTSRIWTPPKSIRGEQCKRPRRPLNSNSEARGHLSAMGEITDKTSIYHEGMRKLQDQRETRPLADRLEQVTFRTAFTEEDRTFIERSPLFFIASADGQGHPDCSYKGGLPGFVRVIDERTPAFPDYDGNGMTDRLAMCWSTLMWGCCSWILNSRSSCAVQLGFAISRLRSCRRCRGRSACVGFRWRPRKFPRSWNRDKWLRADRSRRWPPVP